MIPLLLLLGPIGGIALAFNSPEELLPGRYIFHKAAFSAMLCAEIVGLYVLLLPETGFMKAVCLMAPMLILTVTAFLKDSTSLLIHNTMTWGMSALVSGSIIPLSLTIIGSLFTVLYLSSYHVKKEIIDSRDLLHSNKAFLPALIISIIFSLF